MTREELNKSVIRQFPVEKDRVETGPIQFGDDWPGTFIRGDHSAHFAMHLELILKGESDVISRMVVEGLLDTLKSCDLTK